jgi:hypothetical protein
MKPNAIALPAADPAAHGAQQFRSPRQGPPAPPLN